MVDATTPYIVLTGSLAIDQILHYDGSLAEQLASTKLSSLSLSVLLSGFVQSEGGTAGNIAYSLALLGERPVLVASIGREQAGYLDRLARMGVEVSLVHISPSRTASFTVLTDSQACQIGGFYPGAMADAMSLSLQRFVGQNAIIMLSAHDPRQMGVQLIEAVQGRLRLIFDIGQQVAALRPEVIRQGLAASELLLVNEYELDLLSKKIGMPPEAIYEMVPATIVTLGVQGSRLHQRGQSAQGQAISAVMAQAVDPTGAGDAYRAGLLYGYMRNWPLLVCMQLGATLAAFCVEFHGTQQHNFSREALLERYQRTYGQAINL